MVAAALVLCAACADVPPLPPGAFFASGLFETSIRLGLPLPKGAVPAVWTYAYRGAAGGKPEHLSELDFPEFGKGGVFEKALYNAYCGVKEDTVTADVAAVVD